ncbi:LysR substrate-binding domain-containing protein [Poseidonocella sp. HB161398]|uniref:LysR substrate-binding domain-containing protein n=1 Tax=Poseidonocella sp. HB161398 TaxID=2320855 RepID=UPI001485EDCF|nr:LysR substrate-binding domain-containing protein [Poseidonocella sp. HB161398]
MRRRLPSLNALRVFEAAARHMSFTEAAAELHVTQGAVSRQVKALEEELGTALFIRHIRRLELTRDGETLYPGLRSALDELSRSVARVDQRQTSGVITVSVLPTLAMNWLMPRLDDFVRQHPEIEVRIVTTIGAVDFAREDVDLAIRVGTPGAEAPEGGAPRIDLRMTQDWENLRSEKLMEDELVPLAAPGLLREGPAIREPADVLAYPLLHLGTRIHAWPDWFRAMGIEIEVSPEEPQFGHFFMELAAARRGDGIAIAPSVLVEEDLATGRLVPALRRSVRSAGAYHVLGRDHQWSLPKVRSFRKWLGEEAAKQRLADRQWR